MYFKSSNLVAQVNRVFNTMSLGVTTSYHNSSNSTISSVLGQQYLYNSSFSKPPNNTFLTNSFINTASMLKIAYYCIGSVGFAFNGFVAFVLIYVDKSTNNTSAFHVRWQVNFVSVDKYKKEISVSFTSIQRIVFKSL